MYFPLNLTYFYKKKSMDEHHTIMHSRLLTKPIEFSHHIKKF